MVVKRVSVPIADPPKREANELIGRLNNVVCLKLRHVTLAGPLASRNTSDVTHALSVMHPYSTEIIATHVSRLHGDRANC